CRTLRVILWLRPPTRVTPTGTTDGRFTVFDSRRPRHGRRRRPHSKLFPGATGLGWNRGRFRDTLPGGDADRTGDAFRSDHVNRSAPMDVFLQPWPWWISGPLIGLTVPLLYVLAGKA